MMSFLHTSLINQGYPKNTPGRRNGYPKENYYYCSECRFYVERSINEYIALKNLSLKEISYKICQKGVSKDLVDKYIYDNKEKMEQYEISSAKNIIIKKSNLEEFEIRNYLSKKGYLSENINIAFDDLEYK